MISRKFSQKRFQLTVFYMAFLIATSDVSTCKEIQLDQVNLTGYETHVLLPQKDLQQVFQDWTKPLEFPQKFQSELRFETRLQDGLQKFLNANNIDVEVRVSKESDNSLTLSIMRKICAGDSFSLWELVVKILFFLIGFVNEFLGEVPSVTRLPARIADENLIGRPNGHPNSISET